MTNEDEAGNLAAWAIRRAELELATLANEAGAQARPGFMWAGDAVRRIAWGKVIYPYPDRMQPVAAFAQVQEASRKLCDRLAAGDIQATGRRGRRASGRLVAHEAMDIPRASFRPGVGINLSSWISPDDNGSNHDYQIWREADAPDWGEVMLRAADVERLWPLPPVTLEAAKKWMREYGRGVKKQDEPDCMNALECSRDVARKAFDGHFGPPKMGRPLKGTSPRKSR